MGSMTAPLSVPPVSFAAALWDMDGTLVDTEPYWIAEEQALMNAHGLSWSHADSMQLVGNELMVSAEVLRSHGLPLPAEEIVETLIAGVIERIHAHVPFRPGARELLRQFAQAGIPCALVTMSYRRLAEAVLHALPGEWFAAVVPGDEVTHGKPHPEPYLRGAELLGVAPADCLSFEDSIPGLTSAVDAGTRAFGIRHLVDLDEAAGRAVLLPSLEGVTLAELDRLAAGAAQH